MPRQATTPSRSQRRRLSVRCVSASVWFQALEPRQLMSAESPSPADGMDYHFVLSDTEPSATPVITADTGSFSRMSLPDGFTWFDGTRNSQLRALDPSGFALTKVDGYEIWPLNTVGGGANKTGELSETRTRSFARYMSGRVDVLIIDIEHWPLDIRGATRASVTQSVNKIKQMFGWIREEAPDLKLGFYGHLSLSDTYASTEFSTHGEIAATTNHPWYKANIARASDNYADWQTANEFLQSLAESVDYVFPSLYTGSPDVSSWVQYARYTIEDSRRYGKPVIPFIWPKYHDSVATIGGTYLSADMWQAQLDTVREYAEGAVIWLEVGSSFSASDMWVDRLLQKTQYDHHDFNPSNLVAPSTSPQTPAPSVAPVLQPSVASSLLGSDTSSRSLFSGKNAIV